MATRNFRKEICRHCGLKLLVPFEERTIHCPSCGGITILQSRFNGNVHYLPINTQVTGSNQVSPSLAHGKKRAVLCGITYKGHQKSLKGSVNDVLIMRELLIKRLGFPSSSVLLLTEEERDPYRIPTKHNIRASLRWLIKGCRSGDSLVFYYSGHGSRVRDRDGDEIDGYDESLLPVDYETEGRILDDEINATIVRPLPHGATLHAIIDTCFSGTFLDLPHVCSINRLECQNFNHFTIKTCNRTHHFREGYYKWDDHRVSHAYKGSSGGFAICISACKDHQNSADTTAFSGTATGALTYSFVKTLEQETELTYGRLLIAMIERIRKAQEQVGLKESHESQVYFY
ncbi:Hypothetical predicted protein [Olea europaea subsp. europaea]|uniref:Peptidase C14 caspase domain-containing protein n=1 Tax=Olea europaea subsp. europaea TaxID=158383 RepID=A0A8S0R976_OLEEU|nr:Hypothetical predicted protein [Olea europaea subsp. europaea]